MQLVFSTESDFLSAPAETKNNRHGYTILSGTTTFFVWATTPVQAMGLVAKQTALMSAALYRPKKPVTQEQVEIDPQLFAAVTALPDAQKARLRVLLRRTPGA